jgi:guanine deaminase
MQALSGEMFYECTLVERMERIRVLRSNSLLIHGVWLADEDFDRMAVACPGISHNPASNLKLGSGIAPVIRMREREIAIGLGTDNHDANDGCSMFEAVKWGKLLQVVRESDYKR